MLKKLAVNMITVVAILVLIGCSSVKTAEKPDDAVTETGCEDAGEDNSEPVNEEAKDLPVDEAESEVSSGPVLASVSDINLTDVDGSGHDYTFTYGGEEFLAVYSTPENWKVFDSYKINSESDLLIICQALIDEHPIHGRDMVSYRTAEDMVYEWQIHNLAYTFLDDDDPLKDDSRDVDLDPKDQGLTIEEFYKSRTGKELDLRTVLGSD